MNAVASVVSVSVLCDQDDQVVPAHQVDDIDEVHELDPVHQVDHKDDFYLKATPLPPAPMLALCLECCFVWHCETEQHHGKYVLVLVGCICEPAA